MLRKGRTARRRDLPCIPTPMRMLRRVHCCHVRTARIPIRPFRGLQLRQPLSSMAGRGRYVSLLPRGCSVDYEYDGAPEIFGSRIPRGWPVPAPVVVFLKAAAHHHTGMEPGMRSYRDKALPFRLRRPIPCRCVYFVRRPPPSSFGATARDMKPPPPCSDRRYRCVAKCDHRPVSASARHIRTQATLSPSGSARRKPSLKPASISRSLASHTRTTPASPTVASGADP